jgi:hypothetical protein
MDDVQNHFDFLDVPFYLIYDAINECDTENIQ